MKLWEEHIKKMEMIDEKFEEFITIILEFLSNFFFFKKKK